MDTARTPPQRRHVSASSSSSNDTSPPPLLPSHSCSLSADQELRRASGESRRPMSVSLSVSIIERTHLCAQPMHAVTADLSQPGYRLLPSSTLLLLSLVADRCICQTVFHLLWAGRTALSNSLPNLHLSAATSPIAEDRGARTIPLPMLLFHLHSRYHSYQTRRENISRQGVANSRHNIADLQSSHWHD